MGTHVPGSQSFFIFLHHFVLAKLATRGIRSKCDGLTSAGLAVREQHVARVTATLVAAGVVNTQRHTATVLH